MRILDKEQQSENDTYIDSLSKDLALIMYELRNDRAVASDYLKTIRSFVSSLKMDLDEEYEKGYSTGYDIGYHDGSLSRSDDELKTVNVYTDEKGKLHQVSYAINKALESQQQKHTQELSQAKEEERQRIIDLLTSGKGRETGIWHYELNDHNEMEASYTGDYLSLKEVVNQLTNPKESK